MTIPLEELLTRSSVEDIVLSPRGLCFYENFAWHGPQRSPDSEPKQLWHLANKIAEEARLQLGLTQPSVDSFLPVSKALSFRAHVVVPPLVLEGPEITLRRLPSLERFRLDDFVMSPAERDLLDHAVREGLSILVSGSTGAGKSSFLTALLRQIPPTDRVLILEDSPELPIPGPLCSKLLCRNDRFGFRQGAAWSLEDLVFESLRMRPDRIVVGECRGREAAAIRQALQTGHRGTWTTLHAAHPAEARQRFETLCSPTSSALNDSPWDLVVQLGRDLQGRRAVLSIDRKAALP
jgi:pilus assembly protein CpaF